MRERKWRGIEELGCVTEFQSMGQPEKKKSDWGMSDRGSAWYYNICVTPFI